MKKKIHSINKKRNGYILIFLIIALSFAIIVAFPMQLYTTPELPATDDCYLENAEPMYDISFNNTKYRLIRAKSSTINEEIKAHFTPVGKVKNYLGEERTAYTAWIDGLKQEARRGIYTDITGIENLFFIHSYEDNAQSPYPGHVFLDIYLKKTEPVPPFIVSFCKDITRVSPLKLFVNQDNETVPPLTINTNELYDKKPSTFRPCSPDECEPPANTNYSLVSYEVFRGRINLMEEGWWPSAKVKVKVADTETEYEVNYAFATPIKLIALFMPDPEEPETLLQFNYIPESMALPARVPPPDLNKNYQDPNWDDKSLMLRAFFPLQIPNWGWWTPECKPAIYLYPKTAMNVNVKVNPKGHFTYTDPIYDGERGWNVKAYPSGKLEWLDNVYGINSKGEKRSTNLYDYLYYESKIHDSMIEKPEEGFVVKYEDLDEFYLNTLPLLGLNEQEIKDYVEYWQKVLPYSPYYFIGIMSQENINQIEPMEITPKPDLINRVRLYYEALEQPKEGNAPEITQNLEPNTENLFKVTEWGGMVKQDRNHPFTCSM